MEEPVELFEHNEIGYQELCRALETNNTATLNRATGTGKSFILLKYMYMHKDQRFLYVSPSYNVIDQLIEDCIDLGIDPKELKLDTIIYRNLSRNTVQKLVDNYDVIVFDEHQRTGGQDAFKYISQLKTEFLKDGNNKKFIGMSATPVRYLDHERNMTEELFDGNEASKLSLPKAWADGLLPVPVFYASKRSCLDKLGRCYARIARMAPGQEKGIFTRSANRLSEEIPPYEKSMQELLEHYLGKEHSKTLVFCSTIKQVKEVKEEIPTWFKNIGVPNVYAVHSAQSRAKNKQQYDDFNNSEDGRDVLISIDVLSEGAHAKGVDSLILLRRTKSPRIFLQHIGRGMSASNKDKRIVILDLVNNFEGHKEIRRLFEEFKEEIDRKIKEHPEKKEYYLELLSRFEIIDDARDLNKRIDDLKAQITTEVIIKSRVNYYTNKLIEAAKKMSSLEILQDPELKKAYAGLTRYYKYVTNSQFARLIDADLILPMDFNMSYAERLRLLGSYDSFYEKEKELKETRFNRLIEFIQEKGGMPIYTNEKNELEMYNLYYELLPELSTEQAEEIVELMKQYGHEFSCVEKVHLNIPLKESDLLELKEYGESFVERCEFLPEDLRSAIEKANETQDSNTVKELETILEKNDLLIAQDQEESERMRLDCIERITQAINDNPYMDEEHLEKQITDFREFFGTQDVLTIKNRFMDAKKKMLREALKFDFFYSFEELCKKLASWELGDIKNHERNYHYANLKYEEIERILEFMSKHDGKLPDESVSMNERFLRMGFDSLPEDLKIELSCNTGKKGVYKPIEETREIIRRNKRDMECKQVLVDYMKFFKENGKKPLKNSENKKEAELAEGFEEIINSLPGSYTKELRSVLNQKKDLNVSMREYFRNKRAIQDAERARDKLEKEKGDK